jgi:hypothetical protein
MRSSFSRTSAVTAICLLILTACAGGTNGVPSTAQGQGGSSRIAGDARSNNLSGQYVGKFTDIAYGVGKAKASYAQYKDGVGGVLTIKYASSMVSASVALVAAGSTVDGTTVAGSGSLYCTFSTTSTYDSKTHTMSGSYAAVHGCAGDSGTFYLRQKCFYKGGGAVDVRPESTPRSC